MRANFLLLFLSILIPLAAIETFFRFNYTAPWYMEVKEEVPVAGQQSPGEIDLTAFLVYQSKTALAESRFVFDRENVDSFLLRQVNALEPGSGGPRVLVLGDSFTYGAGVDDKDKVFPGLLAQRFAPDGVSLFNAGIPGSLTNWWVDIYSYLNGSVEPVGTSYDFLFDKFKPDVVLIVFFLRDGTLTGSIGAFFGPIYEDIVLANSRSFMYRYFYTYRYIRDGYDRMRISEEYTQALKKSYFGDESETEEWQRAKSNLIKLKELASRDSAEVALVVFPILIGLDGDYLFADIVDEVITFGDSIGLETYSLLEAYGGYVGPELWVSEIDQHPNELGHEVAAQALAPLVTRLLAR